MSRWRGAALLVMAGPWLSGPVLAGPRGPSPEEELGVLAHRDLAAVQSSVFSTEGRLEVGVQSGLLPVDPYVIGVLLGIQGTWHVGPELGLSLSAQYGDGRETWASQTLRAEGIRVDAYRPRFASHLEAVWSPIYAKLSLRGRRVVHFDVALTGGLSCFLAERTIYNDVDPTADADRFNFPLGLGLGLLHRYYLRLGGQTFAIRVDLKDSLYPATSLAGIPGVKHNIAFGLGLSVLLPLKTRPDDGEAERAP